MTHPPPDSPASVSAPGLSTVEKGAFLKALDRPEEGRRMAFLDHTLGRASRLRRRVDALLSAHTLAPSTFLAPPPGHRFPEPSPEGAGAGPNAAPAEGRPAFSFSFPLPGVQDQDDRPENQRSLLRKEIGEPGVAVMVPSTVDGMASPSRRNLKPDTPGGGIHPA